jgi:hypothetical protein
MVEKREGGAKGHAPMTAHGSFATVEAFVGAAHATIMSLNGGVLPDWALVGPTIVFALKRCLVTHDELATAPFTDAQFSTWKAEWAKAGGSATNPIP